MESTVHQKKSFCATIEMVSELLWQNCRKTVAKLCPKLCPFPPPRTSPGRPNPSLSRTFSQNPYLSQHFPVKIFGNSSSPYLTRTCSPSKTFRHWAFGHLTKHPPPRASPGGANPYLTQTFSGRVRDDTPSHPTVLLVSSGT